MEVFGESIEYYTQLQQDGRSRASSRQARVSMIVDGLGTIPAVTGEALARGMANFQEATKDLAS